MDTATNPSPGFKTNPGHTITVEPYAGTVTVKSSGAVIASSKNALVLREVKYPPVFYIPFKDIDFALLTASDTSSHCPFKGDASYWSLAGEGQKDVMWAYQEPFDEMTWIRDHGAFYPNKVRIEATPS